jgi:hypothetical protein
MRLKICPYCGGNKFGKRWTDGRKLVQYCNGYDDYQGDNCQWVSDPYTPPKRRITDTKELRIDDFCGWDYIIYDCYGHVKTLSATYNSKPEAMRELERELKQGREDVDGGPYTAVLFKTPSKIVLKGKMFRFKNGIGQIKKK